MARIRTIKPELFKHECLFDLERETGLPIRLAFIGLFTVADREGRFKWRPMALKTDVLPYDDVNFSSLMDAMCGAGLLKKYEVGNETYGCIPTFSKHQAINQREAQSSIPSPEDGCQVDVEATHVHAHAGTEMHGYQYSGINIPPALRDTIFARDGKVCCRCGAVHDLTIDHIFPRCIGGTHALTNLRVLCRACNSARPVQGHALIADLARDGLTLDDMQRICMHVQARGEGKGREGKGREKEGKEIATALRLLPSEKAEQKPKAESQTAATWEAYASAYQNRYGADPVRNASVNGKLAQFVQRIGADEAPQVARFFVNHNNGYYVREMHAVGPMLKDAEKLRTEWATNTRMTNTKAQQADKTATNLDAFAPLIAAAKAREEAERNQHAEQ